MLCERHVGKLLRKSRPSFDARSSPRTVSNVFCPSARGSRRSRRVPVCSDICTGTPARPVSCPWEEREPPRARANLHGAQDRRAADSCAQKSMITEVVSGSAGKRLVTRRTTPRDRPSSTIAGPRRGLRTARIDLGRRPPQADCELCQSQPQFSGCTQRSVRIAAGERERVCARPSADRTEANAAEFEHTYLPPRAIGAHAAQRPARQRSISSSMSIRGSAAISAAEMGGGSKSLSSMRSSARRRSGASLASRQREAGTTAAMRAAW